MNLAALCHTEKSLNRLETPHRNLIQDLAKMVDFSQVQTPYESKEYLWRAMQDNKISIPSELFENLEKDDSLEMWSSFVNGTEGLQFVFAMGPILRQISYSLDELASSPWHELFSRQDIFVQQIMGAYVEALASNQTQRNVTEWHEVAETKSLYRARLLIKVKQITPFESRNGFRGAFALVKAKQPPGLVGIAQSLRALKNRMRPTFQN